MPLLIEQESIFNLIVVLCYNLLMFNNIHVEKHKISGGLWFAAWLFTIGFANLSFGQGVLALIVWPYYLGVRFSMGY